MKTYHKILRLLPGCDAQPGDVVETTDWPNAGALERQRHIAKHAEPPPRAVVVVEESAEDEDAKEDRKPRRPSIRFAKGAGA